MSKKNKEKYPAEIAAELLPASRRTVSLNGNTKRDASEKDSEDYTYMAKDMIDKIIEKSASYTYDVNADPLYNQYRDMYRKESTLAAKDIFGLASALTGGYGNSYAATAATSAAGQYVDKLAEKEAELEQNHYDRYKDELDGMYSVYDAYTDISEREYERERDEKSDLSVQKENELEFAYKAAENGDFSYLEALGVDVTNLRQQDSFGDAEFMAKYGDYSALKELGIDISKLKYEELTDQAEFFAKYGDYSVLREAGVDLTNMKEDELLELAEVYAKYGDYSLLKALGVDTADRETDEYYDRLLTWARYLRALRW